MNSRIVFHVDFDYFYAQCEEIRDPKLKTKPVCVCVFSDRGGDSGAIATANYSARNFGVKSGIPISIAKKKLEKCDDAIFLPVDFEYYTSMSEKSMEIISQNADIFEYVGRDEAYLDVTKKVNHDFKTAEHLAQQIKNTIRNETKLSCSFGISPNKLISKIASDYNKPDGMTVVTPEKINSFLEPMKIGRIPGVGKKTEEIFSKMNIVTIKDLKKLDIFSLNNILGRKTASYIFNASKGIDEEPVKIREHNLQYSKISTLSKDSNDYEFLHENLLKLCDEVFEIVKKNNKMFRSVGISFVLTDLSNKTKSKMLRNPSNNIEELKKNLELLLSESVDSKLGQVRRLGVKVSELTEITGQSNITNYF